MINYITGDDITAEVKMIRNAFKGTILIVEGDQDSLLFEKFIKNDNCRTIPARGKDNALHAIEALEDDNFKGAVSIVDADFWHILPPNNLSSNILVTDYHDVEIMIFESEALSQILNEYGSKNKIDKFRNSYKEDVRQILYNAAFPLSVLRF